MAPHQAKRTTKPAPEEAEEVEQRMKVTVTVDDVPYPLYPDEISNRDELDLWKETGLTVSELFETDPWPRFMVAAAMWLSLRTRGARPSYDDVAALITADTALTKVLGEPVAEGEAGPKDSGAD